MRAPCALCIAALAFLSLPGAATAESARVLVWPERPGVDVAGGDDAVSAAGFAVSDRTPVEAALQRGAAAADTGSRAAAEAAETTLRRSQELYLAQDFAEMSANVDRLWNSAALVELARPAHADTLWRLAFESGLARLFETKDLARAWFLLALALSPERRPDATIYGARVSAAFNDAVVAGSTLVGHPTSIRLVPEDATVTVDGRPLISSDRAALLKPGLHIVSARAAGFRPRAEVIDTTNRTEIALELEPTPAGAESIGGYWSRGELPRSSARVRQLLSRIGSDAGASVLVLVDRANGQHRAQLLRDGQLGSEVVANSASEAVAAALRGLGKDGRLLATLPNEATTEDGAGKSVFKTWWFWTGVGAVVAGAVATSVFFATRSTTDRLEVFVQ